MSTKNTIQILAKISKRPKRITLLEESGHLIVMFRYILYFAISMFLHNFIKSMQNVFFFTDCN